MKNLSGMSNVNGNQHFSKKWKIFISHTSELSSLEGSSYVDKAINAVRTRHHIPVEMRDFPHSASDQTITMQSKSKNVMYTLVFSE